MQTSAQRKVFASTSFPLAFDLFFFNILSEISFTVLFKDANWFYYIAGFMELTLSNKKLKHEEL